MQASSSIAFYEQNLTIMKMGFASSSAGEESTCNAGELGSIPGSERSPGEGIDLATPVFLPREFHGLYIPWDHKELNTTEGLSLSISL